MKLLIATCQLQLSYQNALIRSTWKVLLSELTPIIFNMELTHLGSETFICCLASRPLNCMI